MFHFDGQLFHVGIRVTDLATAMEEISASSGVSWASVRDWPMDVWPAELGGGAVVKMKDRLVFMR